MGASGEGYGSWPCESSAAFPLTSSQGLAWTPSKFDAFWGSCAMWRWESSGGEVVYFGDLLGYQFELCSRRVLGQDARAPDGLRFEILLYLVEAGEKLRVLALPGILYSCWARCVQFFLRGIFEDVASESNNRVEGLVAQTLDS